MRSGWFALAPAMLLACTGCEGLEGLSGGRPDAGSHDARPSLPDAMADVMPDAMPVDAAHDSPSDAKDAQVGEGGPSHAIALRQVISPGYTDAASRSAPAMITAGDLLVVAVYWHASTATVQVTDTLGNAWAHADPQNNVDMNSEVQIWYAENAKGGGDTVTVTQSSGAEPLGFYLLEYEGIRPLGSLDSQNGQFAVNVSNEMQVGTLMTTGPWDVIVAIFSDTNGAGVIVAETGFTAESVDANFYSMVEDDAPMGVPPGSYSPTATLPAGRMDMSWSASAAAFMAQ